MRATEALPITGLPDGIDQEILYRLQYDFPTTTRPFLAIARGVGTGEREVLGRIARLKRDGVVRQISPIFDSSRLGYQSTLAAFKVERNRVEHVAARLNEHPGISHNYLRDGDYNIWFTLTMRKPVRLRAELQRLARSVDVEHWLFLPTLRTFKIGFRLDLRSTDAAGASVVAAARPGSGTESREEIDRDFVRILQGDLPLVSRPFHKAAATLGTTEGNVVAKLRSYIDSGVIRRIAAVLRPTQAGYVSNVLVAWAPSDRQREMLGILAGSFDAISHCYQRPFSPEWPFSVYTMIHGRSVQECRKVIRAIVERTGVTRYRELATKKEFKKLRVVYFPTESPVPSRTASPPRIKEQR